MIEENKNLEENIKRHIDVMLEKVQDDFKVFGEKLNDVPSNVEIIKQDVELLKEDMDYVKSEIVEIKDRFRENDEAMAAKADQKVVENHEIRIVKLENTVLAKAA